LYRSDPKVGGYADPIMNQPLEIYHSADTDDLFMAYGFVHGGVTIPGFDLRCLPMDIETLNQRNLNGVSQVSAASVHAVTKLSKDYFVARTGASFGSHEHGPKLIVQAGRDDLRTVKRIAIPGALTTAALVLKLYLITNRISAELVPVFFEEIPERVASGQFDAGILIHEGQITYHRLGLVAAADMGTWWWSKSGEPLPLGVVVVHRSFGVDAGTAIVQGMRQSIQYALGHRAQALEYALSFGRGMTIDEADRYVGWYVNETTVNLGEVGERSIRRLLEMAVSEEVATMTAPLNFLG
jgi:1,4-dihydroxy-6-naphthoate synthase